MLFKNNKGFTLVEMLISMTIFSAFVGILITSYTGIVKSQREANEYRVMYVEGRHVFETLVQELREGMVDYAFYAEGELLGERSDIRLVSKDARTFTKINYYANNAVVSLSKARLDPNQEAGKGQPVFGESQKLNDKVRVSDFKIYVSPVIDPYNEDYVEYDANQFHPKVTIYAKFEREFSDGRNYTMDLQTTVSSRVYNQVYEVQ